MIIIASLILTLFLATLILTIFHYTTDRRKYFDLKKVPFKEPCPIFGNFGATLLMRKSFTATIKCFYEKFRNEKLVGIFQARRPSLMLIDMDLVKFVLQTDFHCFIDRVSTTTDTKREPLIRNLFNMSGDEWKAMRQIVTPTFSSAKLKGMFPLVAECAQTLKLVLLKSDTNEVNIPHIMTRYTTDVLGSCAFGVDPGSIKDIDAPFYVMVQKMIKATRTAMLKRYVRAYFPKLFKLLDLHTYPAEVEVFFTTLISEVLAQKRRSGDTRPDFLQLMMNVQSSDSTLEMTDQLITSNSFIFLLAGLETSANTIAFCLYQLAKDQDLQEQLRNEIKEALKRHGGLTYEAAKAMNLVNKTMMETLRLHPPSPLTTRLCTSECSLPGTEVKVQVKEGIIIPIHAIQNDATYFPDPDKFDPNRFDSEHNPQGFLAFGDGPRSCPGARFAQLMITAGLSVILSTFIVEPCAKTTPTIEYDPRSVMLKNKGGIYLKLTPLPQ